MTILVTGTTGTVGRHVVEQLIQRGADVRGNLLDPDSLRTYRDYVAEITA